MNLFPGLSDVYFKQCIDDMSASSKVSGIDHNLSFGWEIGDIVIYVVHYFPYPFINLVQARLKIGRNVDYIKLVRTVQQIYKEEISEEPGPCSGPIIPSGLDQPVLDLDSN
jgi:hypothetical protein